MRSHWILVIVSIDFVLLQIIFGMHLIVLSCIFIKLTNCAVFQTFSNTPNLVQQNIVSVNPTAAQGAQPYNIWNQPYWYQGAPGYTPPADSNQPVESNSQTNGPVNYATNPMDQTRRKFEEFKVRNWKIYDPVTEAYRYNIFSQKLKNINAHNSNDQQSYQQGINQFSDLTHSQFVAVYLTARVQNNPMVLDALPIVSAATSISSIYTASPNTAIDWRSANIVTPVKDQGRCGACWAFSSVGAVESHVALKTGKAPQIYSEQQLIDCCNKYDDNCIGCDGGWPGSGFDYIGKVGLAKSAVYPNKNVVQSCKETVIVKQFYLQRIMSYNRTNGVKEALAYLAKGPVTALVDGTYWDSYQSGVMSCYSEPNYNHAIIIVSAQKNGVFIAKNSWGTSWGENGYIRINGNVGTSCGLFGYLLTPMLR